MANDLILFHRTTSEAAMTILAEGFRDATGTYLTVNEYTGVWLSDQQLDENEGANGDTLLRVVIPDGDLSDYEWIEEGKPYREFLVPAALINQTATVTIERVDQDGFRLPL